ncbi:MAG: hypothetical protein ABIA67_07280 [Candidatus Margulisiibacteriota bacterium]
MYMGLRTHFNGIINGELGSLFRKRDLANPYTSYWYLFERLNGGNSVELIGKNLRQKVAGGLVSLDELVSGGGATEVFKKAGLFNEAVKCLASRKAEYLSRKPKALDQFILSEKKSIPYVVEHLPAEEMAKALQRLSEPVRQRSVVDLCDMNQTMVGGTSMFILSLKYDGDEIETRYFPGNIQRVLCFKRRAAAVRVINRGLPITDDLVANLSDILDALGRLKTSPLDHILILLREIQGRPYPLLLSDWEWRGIEKEEFLSRDHFTEQARGVLHGVVCEEFNKMREEGGDPLSFRVYIKRSEVNESSLYEINITWEK